MYNVEWMIFPKQHAAMCAMLECFATHPITEAEIRAALQTRNVLGLGAFYLRGTDEEQFVAYLLYEREERQLNLRRIIVHGGHRRRRLGSLLLSKVVAKLSPYRHRRLYHVIRETNVPGQHFLRHEGLTAITPVLRDHFRDYQTNGTAITEDGYEFEFIHPQARKRPGDATVKIAA